jgi:hypothetical protein
VAGLLDKNAPARALERLLNQLAGMHDRLGL